MSDVRVLAVDDEEGMLDVCVDALSVLPQTETVTDRSAEGALNRIEQEQVDLLITDVRMFRMDGVELLKRAREHDPTLPVIIITAYPTVEMAVKAMKLGAADYLTKPFRPENLVGAAQRLLEQRRLRQENDLLQRQMDRRHQFDELVGTSVGMQRVYQRIERVAESDADILILGETGTGKELVARSIHRRSSRAQRRFVPVDCGAIPENLMESEFFGHERGAFTGATSRSLGLLEYADGGSLFLDEVAELPARLQTKLLRVLQERRVRRVGATEERAIDVRTVAATSRDLETEMREGRFREDLYYRINVLRIEIPPLRQRREDTPLLIQHFVSRAAPDMALETLEIDSEAIELLQRYPWPGNVRELQNVVKRVLAMTRGRRIGVDELPDEIVMRSDSASEDGSNDKPNCKTGFFDLRAERIAAFERDYLAAVLEANGGDATRAAREAGVPRGTLYRLLKKYDILPSSYRR